MSKVFIVARRDDSFSTEADAKAAIEAIFAGRDQQRPPEKRFEVEAYKRAAFLTLDQGAQLLEWADPIMTFLIMPNRQGGVDLLNSAKDWRFSTREEAEELIAVFEAVETDLGFFIVEQTLPD